MSLNERIAGDMRVAMKNGDRLRLETLRTVRAALMEKEIELRVGGRTVSAEDEIAVLSKAAKKRRESIELFARGNRGDLVAQEQAELEIIQHYLPPMMTAEEIETVVAEIISATGASTAGDFARVMPAVMKQVKGKADGKLVQEIVRRRLGA